MSGGVSSAFYKARLMQALMGYPQVGNSQNLASTCASSTCGWITHMWGVDVFFIVHRRSPLGPVHPLFRALSGRLKFMVRRHKFNEDFLCLILKWMAGEGKPL